MTNAANAFYIGRGLDYALSMEGALKLKEISYIHAEAYACLSLIHIYIVKAVGNVENIMDAKVLVSGGRGVGSAEHFEMLRDLASCFKGGMAVSYTHLDVYKRQQQRMLRASLILKSLTELLYSSVDRPPSSLQRHL